VNSLLSVRSENQLVQKPPLSVNKKTLDVKSNQSFLNFDPIVDLDKSIDTIDLKKEKVFNEAITTTTTVVNEIKEQANSVFGESVDSALNDSAKQTESVLMEKPLIKNSETNTELATLENGTQVGTIGTKKKKKMSLTKVSSSDFLAIQATAADASKAEQEKKKKPKKKASKTTEDTVLPFDLNDDMQANATNEDQEKTSKLKKVKKVKRKESIATTTAIGAENQEKDEKANGEKKKTKKKLKFEQSN